jgi:hypothetical protein
LQQCGALIDDDALTAGQIRCQTLFVLLHEHDG